MSDLLPVMPGGDWDWMWLLVNCMIIVAESKCKQRVDQKVHRSSGVLIHAL